MVIRVAYVIKLFASCVKPFASSPKFCTIYGDRKWYTPINDPLGTYNYVIDVSNLGVNRVSVKFDCQYTTTKTLFGSPNSYYVIKRTYVPNNLYYIFNKKYTYQELLEIGGR